MRGFTLIELVSVIVILGVLAAIAVPRFADISNDAGNAATRGVSAALTSATVLNRTNKLVNNASAITMGTIPNVCTNTLASQLVDGSTFTATPSNGREFAITGTGDCTGGASDGGKVVVCTITGFKGVSQPLNLICSG